MAKPTIPIEELIALRQQGLTYKDIGRQIGMEPSGIRKRILRYEEQLRIAGAKEDNPVKRDYTTYYLPREEIEKRYGRVGLFKERPRVYKTYGYPDMGQKNERHFAKGGHNG
jgi:hypothetical protein